MGNFFTSYRGGLKVVALGTLLLLAACGKPEDSAQPLTENQRLELQLFDGLNSMRSAPQSHVGPLEAIASRFQGFIYTAANGTRIRTKEGVSAVNEAIDVIGRVPVLPTYTRSALLDASARDHANEQGQTGAVGHYSANGNSPGDRVAKHAKFSAIGENIAYGTFENGQQVAYDLFVDDGVPDRGHRDNMLDTDFKEVGIACGTHPGYGTMCVINYGLNIRPLTN